MTKQNVYNLKLHETIGFSSLNVFVTVLRVPGGWVYTSLDKSHNLLSSVFVPFDNQFQGDDNERKVIDYECPF